MRFILNKYKKFDKNHYKIKKTFALMPIVINNELRWLETCYVRFVYNIDGYAGSLDWSWEPTAFVTKEDYLKYLKEREEFVKNNNIE
jgi:hypothetical protein